MKVSRTLAFRIIDDQITQLINSQMSTRGAWGDTKQQIFLRALDSLGYQLYASQFFPFQERGMFSIHLSSLVHIVWGSIVAPRPIVSISGLLDRLYGPEAQHGTQVRIGEVTAFQVSTTPRHRPMSSQTATTGPQSGQEAELWVSLPT